MINKIAIIGFGSIGKKHYSILKKNQNNKILIFRRNKSNLYPINDIINFNPNIVVLCNPSSFHADLVLSLKKLNAYFFIEKPLDIDEKKLQSIPLSIRKKIFTGYNLKFNSSLIFFREYIYKNKLGKIYHCDVDVGSDLRKWRKKNYEHSVSAKKILGGGVVYELSHEIDYLKWIFNNLLLLYSYTKKTSLLMINTEDYAHSLFLSKNKNYFLNQIPISLNIDFVRAVPKRLVTLFCEKGNFIWDGLSNKVFLQKPNGNIKILFDFNFKPIDSYINEWEYFFKVYNDNNRFELNSFKESYKTLLLCNQIKNNKHND